ncbi:MAG: hypothetical protein RIC55_29315 [Pirellulaceae bacterium]
MFRSLPLVVLALVATGCHAPMPQLQPFAGSGSPRVPPPSTGSYGKADSYYPAGAQSSLTTEPASQQDVAAGTSNILAQQSTAGTWSASDEPVGTGALNSTASHAQATGVSLPVVGASISRENLTTPDNRPASYHSPVTFASSESDTSKSAGGLALSGMRINDATSTAEPQRFIPTGQVIDITQLPRTVPTSGAVGVRGFSQANAAPALLSASPTPARLTASSQAAASSGSGDSAVQVSSDGWRSKYVPQSVGVASN